MIIIFKTWEEHQGRRDVTNPSWFKFYSKTVESAVWDELDDREFRCFVYLLCRANTENDKGCIRVHESNFTRTSGLDVSVLHRTVKKLKELKIVETRTLRGRYGDVTDAIRARYADVTENREREEKERGEEKRREENAHADVTPDAPPAPNPTQAFITTYCEAFKKTYGTNPIIKGKQAGIAKRLASDLNPERSKVLIDAFFRMRDAWFVTRRHDLVTFEQNLNAIVIFADTGKTITRTQINQIERNESAKSQIDRVREGKLTT